MIISRRLKPVIFDKSIREDLMIKQHEEDGAISTGAINKTRSRIIFNHI